MEREDQLFNSALKSRSEALERIKQSQQNLIIVASLLDRIPNLAGLARTCEVILLLWFLLFYLFYYN
jgi:tRNA guanosine-2'-O-methyltransferase